MVCFDGTYSPKQRQPAQQNSKTLCMSWSTVACKVLFRIWGGRQLQNSKSPCMSWSEVRPWYAKYFCEFGASNPKFQGPLHVLVWGQTVACKMLRRNWGKQPKIPKPLACPGLRSDRGMQPCVPKSTSKIYGFRIFLEFRTCRYHRPTDICMPRSDLRPWHADMVRPLEIEHLYPWY